MSSVPANDDIPKNPAERRAWIKYQLELKGLSLRRLAQREAVSHQAMSHALVSPSSHLQPVIAAAVAVSVHRLFPEWYDENGLRTGLTREKQRSTTPASGNVQSAGRG